MANSLGPHDPKASAVRNNAAYGQGKGKTVVPYNPSLSLETLDTGILLLAVFILDLEMDHPSETSLCTVAPSPQTPLLRFFSEGQNAKDYSRKSR